MQIDRRRLAPITMTLGIAAVLVATSASVTSANHHEAGEVENEPKPAKQAKTIVISPGDHVMLVGGRRTLNAEICNAQGKRCKPAQKARWTVKPKDVISLSQKRGAQSTAEGLSGGSAKVTVKQGGATGTTTVKINEPREAEPVEAASEMRLRLVPEHPLVVEGVPYSLTALACPVGASLDTASEGRGSIQNDVPSILDEIEAWKGVGCVDSPILEVDPDEGFREIYRRGNEVLLIKDEGATGFSVRILAEAGGDFPSDKLSYFGADAVDTVLPGLEDGDIEALDVELLETYDLNDDGVLSVADIDEFDRMILAIEGDDLDRDIERDFEERTDLDGDGDWGTGEDDRLIRETIGDLVLDAAKMQPGC